MNTVKIELQEDLVALLHPLNQPTTGVGMPDLINTKQVEGRGRLVCLESEYRGLGTPTSLTDLPITERLVLSTRTVQAHLRSI